VRRRSLDLSIGGWLALGFGVAALLLVLLGAIGWLALERITVEAERSSERIMPRAVAAQRLQAAVLRFGIASRTYALLRDDASLREHLVSAAALELAVEAAGQAARGQADEAAFASIPPLARAYLRTGRVLVGLARDGVAEPGLRAVEAELTRAREAVVGPCEAYFSLQHRELDAAQSRIRELRTRIQRSMVAASLLAGVLFIAATLLTVRAVRRPTARMVAAARHLSAGDFQPALALRRGPDERPRRNELQALSSVLGDMAAELEAREGELRAKGEQLQVQHEELQAQHEELQVQNEQLQIQEEELRAQAEELQRTTTALRETDQRRTEFLATLSHELRNPLSAAASGVTILERAEAGGEQARLARAVIARQLQQLGRLVDDLLDVSRVKSQKIRLRRMSLDLCALLRNTVEDHRPLLEGRGVTLTLELPATPVWVQADPARLAQVVGNLLQNASKFTDRGDRVRVTLSAAGGRAELRVADSGIGIDGEMLERLFEPFIQAERSLARTRGGLGLGLSLVKALVELHGGTVAARSEGQGRGAEFVVELPLAPAQPAPQAPAPAPAPPSRGRRVLLVDDNRDAVESLCALLELSGHEVAIAHGGAEGLARAREWQPDAVVCDIGLPDMDGYEVARRLRAEPALRDLVLVALSGYALDEDLHRAREAGFHAHVAKPASLDRLLEIIGGAGSARSQPA
jgi:signal transduction histidine kinase/ActR/RegA family two-component response regulator